MFHCRQLIIRCFLFIYVLTTIPLRGQPPAGGDSHVFRLTKQVWLNPSVILARQQFEQSTGVRLLILPRLHGSDTVSNTRLEKAFDKLLSFLLFQEQSNGSVRFYFDAKILPNLFR